MFKADSYANIRGYVDNYARTIATKGPIAASSFSNDVFAVLMEKGNVQRLLSHPDCYRLAAMIGIDDDDRVTISLLAVNSSNEVIPEHQLPDDDPDVVPGEEVWPYRKTLGEWDTFLPEASVQRSMQHRQKSIVSKQ